MLNRRITALLLVGAIAVGLCGASVLAADQGAGDSSSPVQTAPGTAEEAARPQAASEDPGQPQEGAVSQSDESEPGEETGGDAAAGAEIVPDPVGTLSFSNLDSRLRANNLNLLALEETIASIEAIDYDEMKDDIRKSLNQIANQQWQMHSISLPSTGNPYQDAINQTMASMMGSSASQSLQQAYNSLRDTFDDLKDGKLQEDYAGVVRQLRNAQNQIVMASQSIYVALVEMELSDRGLDRSREALDRTVQEMELRYDLGQISALNLQQTKAGRTSLLSGQQTLEMNIGSYKTQLELMIGAELSGTIKLQPLPQVTAKELSAMDLEADLAAAKEASYDLFAAKNTLEDAEEEYKDTAKEYNYNEKHYEYVAAKHTWQGAQYTYNAAVQGFEMSFRTLYQQVKDYQQVLQAAKTSLEFQRATYASMQLKYEQGSISQNKLLTAADDLSAAQDTVDGAAIDLFSAYNNYRWAVDYGILN